MRGHFIRFPVIKLFEDTIQRAGRKLPRAKVRPSKWHGKVGCKSVAPLLRLG